MAARPNQDTLDSAAFDKGYTYGLSQQALAHSEP